VAYLLSLKQPTLPGASGVEGEGTMPEISSAPGPGIAANAPVAGAYDAAKGKALFTANCAACHQANGEGLPGAFPPLKGNAAVNDADAAAHIRTILNGLQGANVGGVAYSSPMPPFGGTLNDADIANIINFERSSWGNHGKPVTAQQVAVERARGK
jgi:cytochrome c oxidase cbb3-type subunit 2